MMLPVLHPVCGPAKIVCDECREQTNPEKYIERRENFTDISMRDDVAIPDRRERHNAEIVRIDPRKSFNMMVKQYADR